MNRPPCLAFGIHSVDWGGGVSVRQMVESIKARPHQKRVRVRVVFLASPKTGLHRVRIRGYGVVTTIE